MRTPRRALHAYIHTYIYTHPQFYIIWTIAALLFDEDTKARVVLVRGDISQELLKIVPKEVLPKNMGGDRVVPEAGIF
jgi:hypothetical protein